MNLPLRILLPLPLLFATGCEKASVPPGGAETGMAPTAPADSGAGREYAGKPAAAGDFAKEYEGWKTRAVQEFPDLGKAGTPLNTRFVARAKQLSEQNADELKYPNWPYLLAVKLNAELVSSPRGAPSSEIGKIYTVQELRALGTLPGAAVVVGRVTKFDDIGMPPGVLLVVLDDVLRCELTVFEGAINEGLSWQRSGSMISLVRPTGRGAGPALAALSMGQAIRVEGAFSQRRGAPVLVGTMRRD